MKIDTIEQVTQLLEESKTYITDAIDFTHGTLEKAEEEVTAKYSNIPIWETIILLHAKAVLEIYGGEEALPLVDKVVRTLGYMTSGGILKERLGETGEDTNPTE